jgi:hypothetical protein
LVPGNDLQAGVAFCDRKTAASLAQAKSCGLQGLREHASDREDSCLPHPGHKRIVIVMRAPLFLSRLLSLEIEGEETFPIQVHSVSVIVIGARVLLLLLLPGGIMQMACQKNKSSIKTVC